MKKERLDIPIDPKATNTSFVLPEYSCMTSSYLVFHTNEETIIVVSVIDWMP